MGKKSGQKLKQLYLIEILKKYSDEQHPLNASKICEYLLNYDIVAERKAIYRDIQSLADYGYDIVKTTAPKKGFFLACREFEQPEIYLLSDAVRAAKFISAKKTKELISKFDSMLSIYQAKEHKKNIFFDVQGKCSNEEIYYNIDKICSASEQRKKISFTYTVRYLSDDRIIVRKERKMVISPYAMTWQDDHYYVIGNYSKYNNLIHIRIDRMKAVEILEENIRPFGEVCEYKDFFDVADYTKRLFSMHGGDFTEIELRCKKEIIEQVADRFSENIFIRKVDENYFSFSVKAALSDALVTWIINYGDKIRVESPGILKNMITDRATKILELYCKETKI